MKNITSYLSRNAEKFPEKAAILHPSVISFGQLDREVDYYAAGLKKLGLGKGSRSILLVSAGPEFFILCFSLLRIGAVPIMIDPGMGVKAMVKALAGSKAEAFIGVPRALFLNYLYPDEFKSVRLWISTGKFKIPGIYKSSGLRLETEYPGPQCVVESGNVAGIFFTSGSTGPPKGVVYHAGTMNSLVNLMEGHFKYTPDDIDLCTFPLLGLFVTCLGSSLVIADMNPIRPARLNPDKIIGNLNQFACTQMFGSPMILNRLVQHSEKKQFRLISLKRIISAGAPVPIKLVKNFTELCDNPTSLHTPYGSTEALPISDLVYNNERENQIRDDDYSGGICVGFPLPGIEIRIIRINDNPIEQWSDEIECGLDEIGEITACGPHVTTEYYDNPEANENAKIIGEDGRIWHRMGDLGRKDEKGTLWFYGRKNHRVEYGDKCLYTIPVEAIFNNYPDVSRSALVGIQTEKGSIEPLIWIETNGKKSKGEIRRIEKELAELAASNEQTRDIRKFLFHNDFPVDPRHNAKIFREKLAAEAERRLR